MSDRRALRALLRLELARTLPQISRTLGLAALAAAALAVFGGVTSSRLVLLMTFVAVSGTGAVFQNVIRDKLEGGLDFLVSLPVDRRVLAISRAVACAVLAVPAGDARWENVRELDHVAEHLLAEISHFFEVYKALEPSKSTEIGRWSGRESALEEIEDARRRFPGH